MSRSLSSSLGVSLALCVALAGVPVAQVSATSPVRTPAKRRQYVVVIDAGHQAKDDMRTEPIGPGSKVRKPRVESGTSGSVTHRPESLDNLQVALKLRDALVKRGVKVVMVRTKQKVDIANSTRALIANKAKADLFIRLHCDGSTNASIKGVLMLVPAKNKWTRGFVKASARAGSDVQRAALKATGAKNRGIVNRGDLTGFNWSKVPAILVEMGVMSNHAEDRMLAKASYQGKLASGMASGIMKFLAGK
jgi:N-acetylmuramoyl-L-alanine amidase